MTPRQAHFISSFQFLNTNRNILSRANTSAPLVCAWACCCVIYFKYRCSRSVATCQQYAFKAQRFKNNHVIYVLEPDVEVSSNNA